MKEFKVIDIINRVSLVIDAGENNIHEGQYIAVLNEKGHPIYDDETKEILGYAPTYKAVLNVSKTDEKISFCSALPNEIEHEVLIQYTGLQESPFLGEVRFHIENERLVHENIVRGDKVIILY